MVNHVEGYAGWTAFVQENKGKEIFALFCGGKDASGKSWCPDCVTAEPVSSCKFFSLSYELHEIFYLQRPKLFIP